ncbi:flippase-like domain-containing protein [Candidatus Saccharibacteria bacterium TM7i]|nr:flippase-like domain-containing protein [Candidatus Saccharibacteria bacterium TM7i]
MKKLSFRGWLTLVTLVLLTVVIFAAWPEIQKAWGLMGRVDLWILALLIPVQFFSYYATGGMIFSYLRAKGEIKQMSHWGTTRLALELNFVNHILPSGGAAGFSYLAWVLNRYGVSPARSTMAQILRFTLTFISFVVLLLVALLVLGLNHQADKTMVFIAITLTILAVGATLLVIWMVRSRPRLTRFSKWLTRKVNGIISFFTAGKKKNLVKSKIIVHFFEGLHDDYVGLQKDRKILIIPFIWALIANILDVALIWIAFWALGFPLDPALLFIAFGVASILSAISVTPGGAGVYETVMVMFLAASGVTPDVAIAGTLLARVTLLAGTIVFGYFFYQLTLSTHGKHTVKR